MVREKDPQGLNLTIRTKVGIVFLVQQLSAPLSPSFQFSCVQIEIYVYIYYCEFLDGDLTAIRALAIV